MSESERLQRLKEHTGFDKFDCEICKESKSVRVESSNYNNFYRRVCYSCGVIFDELNGKLRRYTTPSKKYVEDMGER